MIAVIMCAGYGTRMYPLTKNVPKALLKINDTDTILDVLINNINDSGDFKYIYIVSNKKFANNFYEWNKNADYSNTKIVVTKSTNPNNARGAAADLLYIIRRKHIKDDMFILAGDNYFDFSFRIFLNTRSSKFNTIMTHDEYNLEALSKTGVAVIDRNKAHNMVIDFQEKPQKPKTCLAVPPVYFYKKESIKLLKKAIRSMKNKDSLGGIIPVMLKLNQQFEAISMPNKRFDLGSIETYKALYRAVNNKDIE